jgi:hypothetical protein
MCPLLKERGTELPYITANSTPRCRPRRTESRDWGGNCLHMFIAILFSIAEKQ